MFCSKWTFEHLPSPKKVFCLVQLKQKEGVRVARREWLVINPCTLSARVGERERERERMRWGVRVVGGELALGRWMVTPYYSVLTLTMRNGRHPLCMYDEHKTWPETGAKNWQCHYGRHFLWVCVLLCVCLCECVCVHVYMCECMRACIWRVYDVNVTQRDMLSVCI